MPMISDEDYRRLTGAHVLLDQLMTSPKTKRDIQKLVKAVHPNVVTDDDLAEPTIAPLRQELEDLKAFKKKYEDSQIENQFSSSFKRLQDDGWTEDGIEKLKKLMVDRQIPDVDAAAALFEKQNPPARPLPVAVQSRDWNIGDKDDDKFKRLLDDPDRFARDEAAAVLTEVAQEGAPRYGTEQYGWGQPK
jgi:hypothetical protein